LSAPPFSAAATGGEGACMSIVDYHGQIPMHSAAEHMSVGGPGDVGKRPVCARDHRQGSPCGRTDQYPAPCGVFVDLSATNCKGQTAEDSALLGVVVISRPQRLVGPRSVRCGRFACVVALPTSSPSRLRAPLRLQRFCGLSQRGLLRPDLSELCSKRRVCTVRDRL
jgi:hypothetical protein